MSDFTDMIVDGTLDEETGELIDGDSPGYRRRMSEETMSDSSTIMQHAKSDARRYARRQGDPERYECAYTLGVLQAYLEDMAMHDETPAQFVRRKGWQ